MMRIKALDLFSGAAGGWTLGLHHAGIETVAACEIDPWRRAVYARRWPAVRLYDDVRTLTGRRLHADGIVPELVVGSPPCPDFSNANSRAQGIDGERGGLFLEFVRLVRELRPLWVLAENTPGIRTLGIDRILDSLETTGYACRTVVVGAWHAGAPHRRNRCWLVARRTQDRHEQPAADRDSAGLALGQGRRSDDGAELTPLERAIAARTGPLAIAWNGGFAGRGGMDHGLPKGVARAALAAYGDAIVPQIAESLGRFVMQAKT